jgi:hypothetical protein
LASAELRRWLIFGEELRDEALAFGDPLDLECDRLNRRFHPLETLSGFVENRGRQGRPVRSREQLSREADRQRAKNENREYDRYGESLSRTESCEDGAAGRSAGDQPR